MCMIVCMCVIVYVFVYVYVFLYVFVFMYLQYKKLPRNITEMKFLYFPSKPR